MAPRSVGSMKLKRRSISRSSAARVICALTSRTAFSMAARPDARSLLSWGPADGDAGAAANAEAVAAKSAAHRARVLMGCSFSDRFVLLCAHLLRSRRLVTIEGSLAVGLAQLVERKIVVLEVVGSNPTSHPTLLYDHRRAAGETHGAPRGPDAGGRTHGRGRA